MSDPPAVNPLDVGDAFAFPGVAQSYRHRPPYPAAVFDVLQGLMTGERRTILDIGCGTGNVARPLASRVDRVDRVDAVDASAAMIAEGRRLPGGDHPRLHWIVSRVEEAALSPPYALVTAGASLHWMAWDIVLPRLHDALAPGGLLALVSAKATPEDHSWAGELGELVRRYRTSDRWSPDMLPELTRRGLFREQGRTTTEPVPFRQPVDEYVESLHSQSTLARERMGVDAAAAFDTAVRRLLASHVGEVIRSTIVGEVVWGRPLRP